MDDLDPSLRRLIDHVHGARAARASLDIRGGGTKTFYGGPPRGEPLDVGPLRGISSYEPSELVVTVRGGTPLAELEAALADRGQALAFEPPRFASGGTVGGMVAAGLGGPARAAAGSVRDHVLGVTMLNGRGEVLSFGGQVMKNVAGYDVPRLLAGSLGVLGVILEVSLKVLPRPPARLTLEFDGDEAATTAVLRRAAGGALPLSSTSWHEGRLRVRLAGARAAVEAAQRTLGGRALDDDAADAWWTSIRDHRLDVFAPREGESLWRLSVPATAPAADVAGRTLVEWGGALRWVCTDRPAAALHDAARRAGGHAMRFRGAARDADGFAPMPAPMLALHRRLKDAFDPDRVFNPGRLHPEI